MRIKWGTAFNDQGIQRKEQNQPLVIVVALRFLNMSCQIWFEAHNIDYSMFGLSLWVFCMMSQNCILKGSRQALTATDPLRNSLSAQECRSHNAVWPFSCTVPCLCVPLLLRLRFEAFLPRSLEMRCEGWHLPRRQKSSKFRPISQCLIMKFIGFCRFGLEEHLGNIPWVSLSLVTSLSLPITHFLLLLYASNPHFITPIWKNCLLT